MTRRRELGAIALGGAAGTGLRTWIGARFPAGGGWPWSILIVNLTGAFLLAALAGRLAARPRAAPFWRPLLGAGFCGGYTTFSTFEVELVSLGAHGHAATVFGYAATSLAGGLAAVSLGTRVGAGDMRGLRTGRASGEEL